jgi:uncharacterized protein (UPF0332 family)
LHSQQGCLKIDTIQGVLLATTDKSEEILYWWKQAEDSIHSAKAELKFGAYFYSLNRIYYAAFYSVSALLLEEGAAITNHQAIQEAFLEKIIRTGKLDGDWGDFYDLLLKDFLERDSEKLDRFSQEYIQKRIDLCETFLGEVKPLIKTLSGS